LGFVLEDQRPGEPTRELRGRRGDRAVCIALNEVHGIHRVACAIRGIPLTSLRLADERSLFASGPKVTEHLHVHTIFDGPALWRRFPDAIRDEIAELLAPPSSTLTLSAAELSATLGPIGLLREPDAAARILSSLDRLIGIAGAVEEHWDVDPNKVGGGIGSGGDASVKRPVMDAGSRPRDVRTSDPPTLTAVARAAGDVRVRDPAAIAAAAPGAHAALIAAHTPAVMEPFPTIDPMRGDLEAITGRVVLLPPVAPSTWVKDIGYQVVAAGDATVGWYFVPTKDPGLDRVLRAASRYERATGTSLGDASYALIARITGKPRMAVVGGKGVVGLDLATLGALIGDRLFVDATVVVDGESRFAGESSGPGRTGRE
ncbi:MAG: hypothetical protein KC464_31070, partial [Myxococcales bacterium]|nr:hypothetical protein [Myxococcales bacterium]